MFSKKEQLLKRTPKNGVDRKQFINLLVEEFLQTKSFDAKCQVLANLVNFAYDPINYEFLRESCSIDLFLNELTNPTDPILTQFSCSGICNLCLDPENADHIIKYNGVDLLINQLKSENEETVLNAITSLIYLSPRAPKGSVAKPEVLQLMVQYRGSSDARLKNLANIFLEDVCERKQLEVFEGDVLKNSVGQMDSLKMIPLPEN